MSSVLNFDEMRERDNGRFILPAGPSDLCFNKNEFLEESFSVDLFLQEHKKKANLETIRDDLGIYLKVLRSAMIELINKDYADFVNLSSNLIGLDKAIHNIHVPLGQLKEEILQVKQTLEESMTDVSVQLNHRRALHTKKQVLMNLSYVQKVLKKLDNLVQNADKPLTANLIERAASEYNRLQFAISKCGPYKTEVVTQKTEQICEILTCNLNRKFLDAIKLQKASEIAHCLRIYVILDRITYVEDLFKKEIIAVKLRDIICENYLNTNSSGLQGVYCSILKVIDEDMKYLLNVTCGNSCEVAGFDFIVNSFWPEVEHRLEVHLSSIYAPGNPEIFYKRFCETMQFLNLLDKRINNADHIKLLHSHSQYKAFLELWNLPVYFQIRFQEIAGSFESALNNSKCTDILVAGSDFHISSTSTLWSCIMQCWTDGIFLKQLGHRFWKLTLQLLARYSIWVEEILSERMECSTPSSTSEEMSGRSLSTVKLSNDSGNGIHFFVYLYMDLQILEKKVPSLEDDVAQKLSNISSQSKSLISKSFVDSKAQIANGLPKISKKIVNGICEASLIHVRQVSDIPRLFRRTNRDAPTKPCPYVAQVLVPFSTFLKDHENEVDSHLLQDWLAKSFSFVTESYYNAVNDVLTSVQKTEESLQRLKKFRDRTSASTVDIRGSDDDKIRKQLVIDVQTYCNGILELGLKEKDVNKLQELLTLVTEASNVLKDIK